ncbi:hypothetical protein LCGC14_1707970 [marine sediment metagenome]|uniref:N-acetyltransferase domain-containing protein n=1 Tax=marine sediment metagenome TaxID=412755 RepID=A0A0F9I3N0_9ZZZZ
MIMRLYKDSDWSEIKDAVEPFSPFLPNLQVGKRSVAVTAIENGKIMGCGGITFISDTEGLVWVKVSKKCRKAAYTWARTIRETFTAMVDSIGEIKISTYIVKDFCKGDKLARMIGLKKTGEFQEYKGNIYYKYSVT